MNFKLLNITAVAIGFLSFTAVFQYIFKDRFISHKTQGQIYHAYRYYDPKLGQFTRTDPMTPKADGGGLNRYAYVVGNPLKYNDPSGHIPQDVLTESQETFNDFSELGLEFVLQVDQVLHHGAGIAIEFVRPPGSSDPLGLGAFALGIGIGGAGGAGSLDDFVVKQLRAKRLTLRELHERSLRELAYDAAEHQASIPTRLRVAEDTAVWRAQRTPLIPYRGYNSARNRERRASLLEGHQSARRDATSREWAMIYRETQQNESMTAHIDELLSQLSSTLGRQIESAQPIGSATLLGNFSTNAVQPVVSGWMTGIEGFSVSTSPFRMFLPHTRAFREVTFSYSDQEGNQLFSLTIRERFTGIDYTNLRLNLAREGLPLPNNVYGPILPDADEIRGPVGD